MHHIERPAPTQRDLVGDLPTPAEVRWEISRRHAELTVLRKLLKVAEDRVRLCPTVGQASSGNAEVN